MATLKTGEIAKRLGCHENTVRAWSDEFRDFMSAGAVGAKRKFSPDDALILATVAQLRSENLTFDEIRRALSAGRRVDGLPPVPTPEEEAARSSIQLVPMPEYTRVLDLLRSKEVELERVLTERDRALADKDTANQQIAELRGEIGELRGRLEAIESERQPAAYWIRIVLIALVGMLIVGGLALVFLVGRAGG